MLRKKIGLMSLFLLAPIMFSLNLLAMKPTKPTEQLEIGQLGTEQRGLILKVLHFVQNTLTQSRGYLFDEDFIQTRLNKISELKRQLKDFPEELFFYQMKTSITVELLKEIFNAKTLERNLVVLSWIKRHLAEINLIPDKEIRDEFKKTYEMMIHYIETHRVQEKYELPKPLPLPGKK